MEKKYTIAVAGTGHKRIPSREGGIEIVVEELSTRSVKSWCDHAGKRGWQEHGGADESPVFGIRAGCVSELEIQKIKTKKALIISGE